MEGLILFFVIFFALLLLGMPILFTLGIASSAYLLLGTGLPLEFIVQKMFSAVDSFPLLAVPFFILAGNMMNIGGVTQRLLDFCNIFVGRFRGGLASVSIVGSMIFAGISGSSVADASGLGGILIPAMNKQGYEPEYSAAINAVSSTMSTLIPPSIAMVLLSTITSASVRDLFFSSAVAGVLLAVIQLIVNGVLSVKRNYAANGKTALKEIPMLVFSCLPSVIMPALILGAIVFGVMTATEAACLAVVYSLFVGKFIYKKLTLKRFFEEVINAAVQTAGIMLIIGCASVLSSIMSYLMLPQGIAAWAMENLASPVAVLALVALISLIAGCFLDLTPALILIGAVFFPVSELVGINPLQFSAVLVLALTIGLFTPPVGMTLIISAKIANTPLVNSFKYCLPFLYPELILLVAMILVPVLSTGLPTLLFG